jgi:two-component system CheB/CheR fusion protein
VKKAALKETVLNKPAVTKSTSKKHKQAFFIVGIGASAGGLEALKIFFDHAVPGSGMAFVIVQHLDPTHRSLLAELISSHTKMTVREISNGLTIEPDCVYVIPPGKGLTLSKKTLVLTELPEEQVKRRPIDSFFYSLADQMKGNAIGIILSGTGTEGALGLKEIKKAGGMTIVQDPPTAQFDGMPQNAIAAGVADYILPPEKMAEQLTDYIKKKGNNTGATSESVVVPENQLSEIFRVIRNQTGYDFSNYKTNTITRRINKRKALNQLDKAEDYASFLERNPDEVTRLYKDFLIGVTSFFRDKEAFKSFEKKAVPHLLEKCRDKQELRAWVCGCSTGEEAYSIAILMREALEKNKQYLKVTIFASDIDDNAIDFARGGIYSETALADVSPERLSRYFLKTRNGYQLKKEIREMVVFAHHNLIKDPPFSKLDLISCRNLLIYIKSDLQKKIIPMFHYSLINDGVLLLGTSESIGENGDLFTVIDEKNKIFKKKNVIVRKPYPLFELPFIERKLNFKKQAQLSSTFQKIAGNKEKNIPDQSPPASVIIDKNDDALYFSGNTGMFFAPPNGVAKWNILEMAKKGLRPALENAIKKAHKNKTEVKKRGIEITGDDGSRRVNLSVKPLLTKQYDSGTLMIVLDSATSEKTTGNSGKRKLKNSDLEKELKITRVDLQTAISDLETSNEDLQSANEELQSTNEELETSREELQSVNEELITVNVELSGKIDQLSQANNDLNNLLRSIEVATVYLDRDLKVKRFTPAATKIFNLIPSDIDRPLTQLSINLHYMTLADDVAHSLKTLEAKTIEVSATDGSWYYMRIIPYRTSENIIEGVLITLVDITNQKMVEQNLTKTNHHLNLVMENLPVVPYTCATVPELKFNFIGKSCEKVTGFLPEQFTGNTTFWINRVHPDDKKKMVKAISDASKKGNDDQLFRWKCSDGKYKQFVNYMRNVVAEKGGETLVIGVWQEIKGNRFLNEKAD